MFLQIFGTLAIVILFATAIGYALMIKQEVIGVCAGWGSVALLMVGKDVLPGVSPHVACTAEHVVSVAALVLMILMAGILLLATWWQHRFHEPTPDQNEVTPTSHESNACRAEEHPEVAAPPATMGKGLFAAKITRPGGIESFFLEEGEIASFAIHLEPEPGDVYVLEWVEMSEAEFEALPQFSGLQEDN